MNLDATQAQLLIILAYCLRDGLIFCLLVWLIISLVKGGHGTPAPIPLPAPVPVPPPAPPGPPDPVPPVPVPVAPHNTGITATSFNDSMGAYGPIDASKPCVALPAAFPSPRPRVRIFGKGKYLGRSVDCDIGDKGPWYDGTAARPADEYWKTGARPRAESDNATNHAGIDLNPAAWRALGSSNPNSEKALVDWDFVDARPAPSPALPVPGTVTLVKNVWPTQAEAESFYGSPHDTSQHVEVPCPWVLNGGKTKSITIHVKCAASLTRILNYIWEHPAIGKSQAKIHEFGYDIFDGSYVDRVIAGTNTESMHGYACAIDFNAAANPQHAPLTETKFKSDSLIVFAFKSEGWIWGGDWSPASIDAMHFQAARVR